MKFTNEDIKIAIRNGNGIRTHILEILNTGKKPEDCISYQGLRQRIDEDEDLQREMAVARDGIDDMGESNFTKALKEGKWEATREWLKYRGRHRGYVQTQEITGKDGTELIPKQDAPPGAYQQWRKELADKEAAGAVSKFAESKTHSDDVGMA